MINISQCKVCKNTKHRLIDFDYKLVPTTSFNKKFRPHQSYICLSCGVITGYPDIDEAALVDYYNGHYRKTETELTISNISVDIPIKYPQSAISMYRAKTFIETINRNSEYPNISILEEDTILDYGGYQGFFLKPISDLYGVNCIVYDYNKKGVELAKKLFDFKGVVASNIYKDVFSEKIKFVTLIHVFEHLKEPVDFLDHLRNSVLEDNGFLYIEIPNPLWLPLSDPTHLFMYTPSVITNILNNNGFIVIDCFETGFPNDHGLFKRFSHISNEHQNIVCLAQKNNSAQKESIAINVDDIYLNIKSNYMRLNLGALKRQLFLASKETSKFLYYMIIIFIDVLSNRKSNKIIGLIKSKVFRR